jgi:hypothetical protein
MPWQGNRGVAEEKAVVSVANARASRDSSRIALGRRRMAFLRQSWSSNYCGVYAAGMFLSLLGKEVNRIEACSLFHLSETNDEYDGATPLEVVRALRQAGALANARWQFFRRFDLTSIQKSLASKSNWRRFPSILFFGIIHRQRGLRARHFAVITDAGCFGLRLLDPLGRDPANGGHNVSLVASGAGHKELRSVGCNYLVDTRIEAAVLYWRAKSSFCKTYGNDLS